MIGSFNFFHSSDWLKKLVGFCYYELVLLSFSFLAKASLVFSVWNEVEDNSCKNHSGETFTVEMYKVLLRDFFLNRFFTNVTAKLS